jgi:hypothetical protein
VVRLKLQTILRRAVGGILFGLLWAFPGALFGLGAGYFGLQAAAAIGSAVSFFIIYPRSLRRTGELVDAYMYYMTACGAIGSGLACLFVGNAIEAMKLAGG